MYFIQEKLGMGRVFKKKDSACVYVVTKVTEIEEIINIFDKRPLNTSKHLNFLIFKEAFRPPPNLCTGGPPAFLLYRNSELDDTLHTKLESLKDEMNRKRIDFKLSPSDHQYLITPY